ncbi:MAG TPA: hypothetical protein PLB67_18785 [Candidatus Hydrogenedentes bacterium]|nr:hypothetical protein [Candidatus Hydrogenedentota bacterium]
MNKSVRKVLEHLSGPTGSIILHVVMLLLLIKLATFETREQTAEIQVIVVDPATVEFDELEPLDHLLEDDFDPSMDLNRDHETAETAEDIFRAENLVISVAESPVIMAGLSQFQSVNLENLVDVGKRTTRFMGNEARGKRFAFVIDYSRSMSDDQLAVMKSELYKAIKGVGEDGLVTVLFFSGPVWRPDQDALAEEKNWTKSRAGGYVLKKGCEGPNPQWLVPTADNLEALERLIYQTPTTLGTDWFTPLKFVLEMSPRPDMVVFMTDGAVSETVSRRTIEYVKGLPQWMVRINTTALGVEPDKAEPLRILAEMTGGKFRLYDKEELARAAQKLPHAPTTFSSKNLRYLGDEDFRQRVQEQMRGTDDVAIEVF